MGDFIAKNGAVLSSVGALGYMYFSVAVLLKLSKLKTLWQSATCFVIISIFFVLLMGIGVAAENKICLAILKNYDSVETGIWILIANTLIFICFYNVIIKQIPIWISIPLPWVFLSVCFLVGNPCSPYMEGVSSHCGIGIIGMLFTYVVLDCILKSALLLIVKSWKGENE
ncbi:hypothetical protein L6278_03125 [Candidatus Parcubacteria bacterium]|nr:hypothetical protein [Patescibacteria group bacterium]MCG2687095.1 hypothetical protein [Candidatus Parcubacteria bacterium]